MSAITYKVPAHLVAAVGNSEVHLLPIHSTGVHRDLVLVFEVERGCEYHVMRSALYPVCKRW